MTQTEFLVDFLRYYCANPEERRNMTPTFPQICRYESQKSTSEGCAIGRHLIGTPEQKRAWDNCKMNTYTGILQVLADPKAYSDYGEVEDIRPEWMKELSAEFLKSMQELHDFDSRWHDDRLSDVGKFHVGDLVIKYGIPKEAVVEWVEDEFIPPFHK